MLPKLSDAEVKLLRLFATIVEAGGFTAAQTQLNISQSRISSMMADLETRLGMRLCQRGRVGFRLTDKGRVVYEASRRLFAGLEDFRAEVGALRGRLVGELTVGVVDNTISNPDSHLAEAISRFSSRPNDVQISVNIAAPTELEQAVLQGRMQVAIGAFHHHAAGLGYERLFMEEQTLCCGRGHPLFARHPDQVTLADVIAVDYADRGYMEGAKTRKPVELAAKATAYHMEALALLVLSGAYIAYLPTHYAQSWVERGQMRPLMPRELAYHSLFELITRRGTHRTLVLRTFLEDLRQAHRHVKLRPGRSAPPSAGVGTSESGAPAAPVRRRAAAK
jgi:DNA-binding transcriptional LysR family regulator